LLQSITGSTDLSIANGNTLLGSTGTVTIVGNAEAQTVRVARGNNAVGTLSVGGTLDLNNFFNVGYGSNSVGKITADVFNKVGNATIIVAADNGEDNYGSVVANSGTVSGSALRVANTARSEGIFSIAGGAVTLSGGLDIATGVDSKGTVLLHTLNISGANDVNIATGGSSTGSLAINTADIAAAAFNIGTGSNAVGTFSLDSGVVNVAGLFSIGSADGTGTLTMNGGSVSAADMAIGTGGTVNLNGGLLTITEPDTLTMDAGSSLFVGMGTLVWSNDVNAASDIAGWVTDGLITWSNTNDVYFGAYDTRYDNGTDSYLFVLTDAGATTVLAAIPEPSTIGLMLATGGGLLLFIRRKFWN
jgi:hypothetical protein